MKKPFDLKKFLAGEPAVSRDGRKVAEFHYFNGSNEESRLVVRFDGVKWLMPLYENGRSHKDSADASRYDLFMETKEEKRWIVIVKRIDGKGESVYIYNQEHVADVWRSDPTYITTIVTTIEV